MKKILLCIFFSLFISSASVSAETGDDAMSQVLKTIIAPSPQAAGIMRYGEYPVGPGTGVPQINIPLYTVSCDGVALPISISYHASGIKVDDIASSVGLGWSLSGLGMISRTICSSPDYQNNGGFYLSGKNDSLIVNKAIPCNVLFNMASTPNSGVDSESDRYYYTFGNKSGFFRYDINTDSIITIPRSTVHIEATSTGYRAIDDDGTIYIFNKKEGTGPSGARFITSWYLTEVITPNKKEIITIEYDTCKYTQTIASELYSFSNSLVSLPGGYSPTREESQFKYTNYDYEIPIVSSIRWQGHSMDFTYVNDRAEYSFGDKGLSMVTVRNFAGRIINRIKLNKSYLGGYKSRNGRTLLSDIIFYGNSMVDSLKYTFDYFGNYLPNYTFIEINNYENIFCSDYWGYYNGKSSEHLVPREYMNTSCSWYGLTADRSPNAYLTKNGTLKSITYPTGGTTYFDYEGNTINDNTPWGGLRIKSITNKIGNQVTRKEVYTYSSGSPSMNKSWNLFAYYMDYVYSYRFGSLGQKVYEIANYYICVGSPILPLTGWSGNPVFYSKIVKTILDGADNPVAKIVYDYIEDRDYDVGHTDEEDDYPRFYSELNNYDQGQVKPLLAEQKEYRYVNGEPQLEKQIINTYEIDTLSTENIVGVHISKDRAYIYLAGDVGDYGPYDDIETFYQDFHFHNVYSVPKYRQLKSTLVRDNVNGYVTTTSYTYDAYGRTQSPVCVMVSDTASNVMRTDYMYPFMDLANTVSWNMYNDHYIDRVIGTTQFYNGTSVSGTKDEYQQISGKYLLANTKKSIGAGTLETRLAYTSYDLHGNVQELLLDNNNRVLIVWGYNQLYPIAKIECGDKPSMISALIGKIANLGGSSPSDSNIQSLRNTVNSLGGMITTYKYIPLLGITEVIDPQGIKTTYSYDVMGRLDGIYDGQGNLRESYEYKYENPTVNP